MSGWCPYSHGLVNKWCETTGEIFHPEISGGLFHPTSRWWFLKYLFFSPRKLGKWSNLFNNFQMACWVTHLKFNPVHAPEKWPLGPQIRKPVPRLPTIMAFRDELLNFGGVDVDWSCQMVNEPHMLLGFFFKNDTWFIERFFANLFLKVV